MCVSVFYIYIYKHNLALNKPQRLICRKAPVNLRKILTVNGWGKTTFLNGTYSVCERMRPRINKAHHFVLVLRLAKSLFTIIPFVHPSRQLPGRINPTNIHSQNESSPSSLDKIPFINTRLGLVLTHINLDTVFLI